MATALLEEAIRHLASIERPSASEGEREAAEWIAAKLRDLGCEARVEAEDAHGTYWWPLGLLTGAAAVTGALASRRARSGRPWRALTAAVGGAAAAAIADDISGGRLWFRRAVLPSRRCWNVVAEAGDPAADETVVLVAHHDAARSGLIFHPAPAQLIGARFPGLLERADTTPPLMWPVVGGPLLVGAGAVAGWLAPVRAGTVLALGSAAAFAEIASREVVPGANDNLTGVATLIGVAEALRRDPVRDLRVLLVSTGSEESFMEGMQGFAHRHFPSLPVDRTHFVCVDTVGSPELIQLEGEGMLRMRDYPESFKGLVSACALQTGVHLRRGLRVRNATHGLIALRAGYPTVMLGSVNHLKLPDNYHWPTDTADNVRLGTVADAVRLCTAVVRRLSPSQDAAPAAVTPTREPEPAPRPAS
ncbi:MAG: hypothetical protein QOI98_141 [Solirubrobacteraceae bacterium]|nr:hypothetical protein [Solirubrobacteraceae bacterium]